MVNISSGLHHTHSIMYTKRFITLVTIYEEEYTMFDGNDNGTQLIELCRTLPDLKLCECVQRVSRPRLNNIFPTKRTFRPRDDFSFIKYPIKNKETRSFFRNIFKFHV